MAVDQKVLTALSASLRDLGESGEAIPAKTIASLAAIVKPGMCLHIDLEASAAIGAPLVTLVERHADDGLLSVLTGRQKQVAGLIIEGMPNREIAERLGISLATVKDHVHAILQRLNLPSRSAVIAASRFSQLR